LNSSVKNKEQYVINQSFRLGWNKHQFLVANYWSRTEVADLFGGINVKEISISHPPNNSGWTIIIKK